MSRETLLRRIETHINTVVQRYADAVTMWDVVNEAIGDGDEGLLRDSVYSRTTGIDFIVTAFKAARAKDPDAVLIYNDYNGHKPGKREKLIELLTQLKQRGVSVDAYGMQGHFELGDDSVPQLRETFDQLRKLNVEVVVSELDIDVVTRGRWWADGGKYRSQLATHDPYKDGIILAYDLFSPLDLCLTRGDPWVLHRGTFSKYIPAGNLFGGTVRYGRYVNRKLTVEEVLERIRKLAERPKVEVHNEGPSSEKTPIFSVRFGNPDGPRFLLLAGKHGSEWENVYGMLITIEQLLDGDVIDLEQFCVVAVPMLNPYGYRNGTRLNAHGVDLNRQLRQTHRRPGPGVSPVLRKRRAVAGRSRYGDADRPRRRDQPDHPPPHRAVVEGITHHE